MLQTSSMHLPPMERANYLKKCWQTGRLQEGIREWSYPTRYRLYRWRTALNGNSLGLRFHFDSVPTPNHLTLGIPDLFAPSSFPPPYCQLEGLANLFSEVDGQLRGIYRLAGEHYQSVRGIDLATLADNEQHHAYHRLYWAVRYACAAAFGHPEAESGLCRDLNAWLSADWSQDRRVAYPYTTAERIASLVEVAFWIHYGSLGDAVRHIKSIKERVFLDAVHLSRNVEYWLAPHNHLLSDARGLYVASMLLPECTEGRSWRKLAFELWDDNFPKLVMEDGSFGEETSFYLFMNCRTALEYVLAARRHEHAFPEGLYERLKRLLELGNELLRKDGSLPRFGNSSPDHVIRDLWGLMMAAHAHGLLLSLPRNQTVTPLTIYYCADFHCSLTGDSQTANSRTSVKDTSHLRSNNKDSVWNEKGQESLSHAVLEKTDSNETSSRLFPEGGWAFLRKADLDAELVVNGDPASRTRGHGDCGRGSFELWWRGSVLIREPGNPTYTLPKRHWYRSGQGQNVTCVNGLPPGISHEYQERMPDWYCGVQEGSWKVKGKDCVIFRCQGFRRLPHPVDWERQWTWETSNRLVMFERLEGQGTVQIDSYLHLGDMPWRDFGDTEWRCQLSGGEQSPVARMIVSTPSGCRAARKEAFFAPEYGVEKPGSTVVLAGKVTLPVAWSVTWEFLV